ncbi:MAG: thiamine diphosphokinase [Clostridiales bacterium]|nr:thiamine diphosphokinase [Clostridiales bacterium]
MAVCYLIGAGSFAVRGLYPKDGDFIIAADDGYTALRMAGLSPDLLVGDFDSLMHIPRDIPREVFSPEKDETDLALALKEGIVRGYRTFRFYGASGGRDDHTHANLQLLGGASRQGFDCKMICPACDIYAVTNGTLELPKFSKGTIVSVFCHGDIARGVTLKGLKYPLDGAALSGDTPLGVSNETTGEKASVSVENGTLLVYVML